MSARPPTPTTLARGWTWFRRTKRIFQATKLTFRLCNVRYGSLDRKATVTDLNQARLPGAETTAGCCAGRARRSIGLCEKRHAH